MKQRKGFKEKYMFILNSFVPMHPNRLRPLGDRRWHWKGCLFSFHIVPIDATRPWNVWTLYIFHILVNKYIFFSNSNLINYKKKFWFFCTKLRYILSKISLCSSIGNRTYNPPRLQSYAFYLLLRLATEEKKSFL